MKKMMILTMMTLSYIGFSQERIHVVAEIKNVPEKGTLMLGIFNSEAQWNKTEPSYYLATNLFSKTATYNFTLPKGRYGFAVFVDNNGNKKYDRGEFYAFSNAYIPMESPQFKKFVIAINKDVKHTFSLKQ